VRVGACCTDQCGPALWIPEVGSQKVTLKARQSEGDGMRHDVQVQTNGGTVRFVLAPETDPEEGEVDLTPMLRTLVAAGLEHPNTGSEDGVPFGTLETAGDIKVTVDGRTLTGTDLDEVLGAGFVHAIKRAIDLEYAAMGAPDEPEAAAPERAVAVDAVLPGQ
jgi:hypothetical protein